MIGDPNYTKEISNQYKIDPKGNNPLGTVFRNLAIGLAPTFYSQGDFYANLEKQRQGLIQDALMKYSPNNQTNLVSNVRRQLQGGALEQGNEVANLINSQGGGIGSQQSARINAMNQANQGANNYATNLFSPQGQQQQMQLLLQLLSSGQNIDMNTIQALFNGIETRNSANSRDRAGAGIGGILNSIGQVAGGLGGFGGGSQQPPIVNTQPPLGGNGGFGNIGYGGGTFNNWQGNGGFGGTGYGG